MLLATTKWSSLLAFLGRVENHQMITCYIVHQSESQCSERNNISLEESNDDMCKTLRFHKQSSITQTRKTRFILCNSSKKASLFPLSQQRISLLARVRIIKN